LLPFCAGITQSAKVGDTPLYSANLTGNGEIVGVSDSGIDMDHCYFQDDNCDPFDQLDMSCRKVPAARLGFCFWRKLAVLLTSGIPCVRAGGVL
jgi:hypothetical protein